jgi:hypothetical protein
MSIRPTTASLGASGLGNVSSTNQSSSVNDTGATDASSKASGKPAKVGFRNVDLIDLGIGTADQLLKEGVRRADLKDGVYAVGSAALKAGGQALHTADKVFDKVNHAVAEGMYRLGQASLKAASKFAHFAGGLIAKAAHSFVNAIKTAYANHKAHQVGGGSNSLRSMRDRSPRQVAASPSKDGNEVASTFASTVRPKRTPHLSAHDRQSIGSTEGRPTKLRDNHHAPDKAKDLHGPKKDDLVFNLTGRRETDPKHLKDIAELQARLDATRRP